MQADPGLLERVVVNLVGNAIRHARPSDRPLLTASAFGDRVQLRVVDRGPGIPRRQRDRSSSRSSGSATPTTPPASDWVSRSPGGSTEAMGGTLEPEDTPGGGLTMVLAAACRCRDAAAPVPGLRERAQEEDP